MKLKTFDLRKAQITHQGMLDCQLCHPASWTERQALTFVNALNPCGTKHGWVQRKTGNKNLAGAPAHVPCEDPNRKDFVHTMYDA